MFPEKHEVLLFHKIHFSVEFTQKPFNRLLPVGLCEIHGCRQLDLIFKIELVTFAVCFMMQTVTHVVKGWDLCS